MTYDKLVELHKDAIFREMLRVCGNREDGEDMLIEALLTAYRESNQLRDEGAFKGWVCKIGRRLCWHLRHKKGVEEILSDEIVEQKEDVNPSPQVSLEANQWQDCLHNAVSTLSETYKQVFVDTQLHGKRVEEVAKELGISTAAAKSRLNRARVQVRQSLEHSLCLSD